MLKTFFSRRWRWTTALVVVAVCVMLQLGLWQVKRLTNRQTFNAEMISRMQAQPLALNEIPLNFENPTNLKYQSATVRGEYDYAQQIALNYQIWEGKPGFHLLTPLMIDGDKQAVLVDRGWIPAEDAAPETWGKYNKEKTAEVKGIIWLADATAMKNGLESGRTWFWVDIKGIQKQVAHPLLPFYIQQAPEASQTDLPYRSNPNVQLSEGKHREYIITWFSLAVILLAGYTQYIWNQSRQAALIDEKIEAKK